MEAIKILVVEDEAITAMDIQSRLQKLGYDVPAISSAGEEALEIVKDLKPGLVLMDIVLKGQMDGTEAARKISELYHIPVVFITAYKDEDTFGRAKLSVPYGYLTKPFETRDLRIAVDLALFKYQSEMKLAAAENRYRSVMQNASCGIFIHDKNGIVSDINKQAAAIFGSEKEKIIGVDFRKFLITADQSYAAVQLQKLLTEKSIGPNIGHVQQPGGAVIDVEFSAVYVENDNENFMVSILNDITERNKLRSQTLLSDKLATVGALAAGIMHEINNPMTWILTNLSYLKDKMKFLQVSDPKQQNLLPKLEDVIKESIQGAERIRDIARDLKGFARADQNSIISIDVHEALNSAINMAHPQYKNCAKLETNFAADIPLLLLNK